MKETVMACHPSIHWGPSAQSLIYLHDGLVWCVLLRLLFVKLYRFSCLLPKTDNIKGTRHRLNNHPIAFVPCAFSDSRFFVRPQFFVASKSPSCGVCE